MILDILRSIFGPRATLALPSPPPLVVEEPPTMQRPLYKETRKHTPNVSPRQIVPTHILMHHTSGSYKGSVSWCMNPASKVSYHCIVSQTGARTVLAGPTMRAWHAGVSSWQGRRDCNSYCIGVAFEGDTYTQPPSEDALMSAVEYIVPLMDEYGIPESNIIRHADVAPGRKNDCSPLALAAVKGIVKRAMK
jgi:N-acetyl-anhydromuramyl-L-alanine amidase AmpD